MALQLYFSAVHSVAELSCGAYIVNSWYDLSRERTSTAKHDDAINSIRYYYTHVTAGVITPSHPALLQAYSHFASILS